MKFLNRMFLGIIVPGLLLGLASGCATLNASNQGAVVRAKSKVAPALVHIRPVKEVFTGGRREEVLVTGSGFIITPDGYVVTNEHVAGESEFVRCVLFNKEEVEAEVVGTDPYTDIAVLKLRTEHTPLPYVQMGTSADLEAGETVMAFGSPHGLARSVSLGIVSVTDRYLEGRGPRVSPYNTWIQTDAAINPGNSGGPLVNLRGRVVGVNARKLGGADNVGFAIPVDIARQVVDDIIENGRVIRSWIGLNIQAMTSLTDDPSQQGVLIGDIDPLSPGEEAQIRPGDILLAVNGEPVNARFVEDLPAVRKRIADLPVGSSAELVLKRGEGTVTISVPTEEKRSLKGDQSEFEEWGFTVSELTPDVVRRARLQSMQGALVSGVQVGGIASNGGLQQGDIILKIDDEPVVSMAGFRQQYEAVVEAEKPLVLLLVKRRALTRFVLVKQESGNGVGDE